MKGDRAGDLFVESSYISPNINPLSTPLYRRGDDLQSSSLPPNPTVLSVIFIPLGTELRRYVFFTLCSRLPANYLHVSPLLRQKHPKISLPRFLIIYEVTL